MSNKGKLIVLYGTNNLGKTTQAKLLVDHLIASGRQAKYQKMPVYDIDPSGVMINEYLRAGNPYKLSAREAQILYAFNRSQYQPTLQATLESGTDVVMEDYWGTGVAWGVGGGVDKDFLLRLNKFCLREDLALLFVGKRFDSGIENNHLHESNNQLTADVDRIHRELAHEFGWKLIDANQSVKEVSEVVWEEVKKLF